METVPGSLTNSLVLGHSETAASHHGEKRCEWLDKTSHREEWM